MLDELANAGRENLDPAHVERYDGKMDAGADEEVELLRSRGLDASSVVVELGCGTGQFAVAVSPWCRRVVAVDVSPLMRGGPAPEAGTPPISATSRSSMPASSLTTTPAIGRMSCTRATPCITFPTSGR